MAFFCSAFFLGTALALMMIGFMGVPGAIIGSGLFALASAFCFVADAILEIR